MTIERISDLDGLQRVLSRLEKTTMPVSKLMARKSDFFEKDRESVVVKGLYTGTKFEASRVACPNYKYFSKKKVYDEPTSLAVSLVVDESGSMFGRKEEAARAFSLIMYDYVELLRERNGIDIPLNIIGHTETGGRTNIFVYADSEKPDKKDRLRLMDIKARANNRDGHAIRLAMNRLEQLDANQKLLVIVTDGQPAAFGYGGAIAEADLRDVARHCEREGIALLVAAIDQDKERIKKIYGAKHFIDIQDLNTLATRICKVIQNELANN
jgi:nitric oxide reductase activation protein